MVIQMKQCKTCIYRSHKNDLLCCQVARLNFEFRKLWQSLPVLGKWIEDYSCGNYEKEQPEWKWEVQHVNCRCSVVPVFEGDKDV